MGKELRLDKFLTDMGKGSRSQIKEAIRKGRVTVNGAPVKKPECRIKVSEDLVLLDKEPVTYVEMEYFMLNKPAGVVSATEDRKYQTVIDLIGDRNRKDLFPVGRLDLDTEGLLLITNDGLLAHQLLSPKKHVDKTYRALCQGSISEEGIRQLEEGILLPDGLKCLPAVLKILSCCPEENTTAVLLTIQEGKFHQVKRMMEAVGCPVLFLKRLSMGPLTLDETLEPGQYRPLTGQELEQLKQL